MPILTFSSDIGTKDYLTGAIKGQLISFIDGLSVVDITHDIIPFNYPQAAYICRNAVFNFPKGTVHLILFNLFDERPEHLVFAEHNGHYFCCADNGLLTMILEEKPQKAVALSLNGNNSLDTLSCTSVFAKAIAEIINGKKIEDLGNADFNIKERSPLKPIVTDDGIDCHILFIDNFENVIVNIRREEFEKYRNGRKFSIVFKRDDVIKKISDNYADVIASEPLAIFNAAGYLEIALSKGNAAGLFGLIGYSEEQQQYFNNRMFYQNVKIFFEQ